jgi:F-type H+-transporting ATPase subunit b
MNMIISLSILSAGARLALMRLVALVADVSEEAAPETGLISPDQAAGYAVTALFTIINIFVAYLILKKFVFKPIIKLLEGRRVAVEEELKQSEEKKKEANSLLAEAKRRIEESRSEAAEILTEARLQAEKQGRMIIAGSKEEAESVVSRAKEDSGRIHNAMLEQMKDEVADLAVAIASKVVGSIIDESHQKEMSDRIMEETLTAEVKSLD